MAPTLNPENRPAVLITGASRGIGRAIAHELGRDHHLILGGRDREALDALAAELPSAQPFVADLADPASLADAVTALDLASDPADGGAAADGDTPGRLAGVVHSAGILVSGTVEELTAEDWNRSFALNVTAVAELTRLLLPALRAARGTVVTINSGSGYSSGAGGGAYSASKFALRALTDALRAEEKVHGVRVSSVHPGRTATDMQRELRSYEGSDYQEEDYMRPETVAATVGLALRLPADAAIDSLSVRPR
ncbi:SDR family oxidoreductase [Brachybacterium muris]|uniref:Short-chain dehydrogenase n=1 Tax=Brachybacterium muris UCD-AY4 TaxID=1249481 RepID=A0A022KYM7_9MICO|nr:SDR family oxidoreductase [Brachybacterium muris]EYT50934.1 short-chain dehydrogenase [Brachybacterium muris UCD-AY4]